MTVEDVNELPWLKKIWYAVQESIKKILEENEAFLDLLEKYEQYIENQWLVLN